MKLFENGVGRPSNEIKKKRRLFVAGISLAVVGLVGLGSILTINATKQNIVSNSKKLKAEASTLDLKLADLDKDGKVTRNDLVKMKERLKNIYPYNMPGDVNKDGIINGMDAQLALEFPDIALLVENVKLLDVSGNGKIDLDDGFRINNMVYSKNTYAYGDLNKDYKVNSTDYKLLTKYLDTNDKINPININVMNLKHFEYADYNSDGISERYGSNTKIGDYWGKTEGLNIFARKKGTEVYSRIEGLGNLNSYSKISIYYQVAGDGKDMKSSIGIYMNGVKRYKKDITLTTNKEGTTKWSGMQKAQFGLYNEVGNDNFIYINLNHGTNKNANTAILKIVKIVLE